MSTAEEGGGSGEEGAERRGEVKERKKNKMTRRRGSN